MAVNLLERTNIFSNVTNQWYKKLQGQKEPESGKLRLSL